jgi:hypothetical protein
VILTLEQIAALTPKSLDRLKSDDYRDTFQDALVGITFKDKVNSMSNEPVQPRPADSGIRRAAVPVEMQNSPEWEGEEPPAVVAPKAAVQPVAAAPATMKEWVYQPTSKDGVAIGGIQRFLFDPTLPNEDPKSLASQLTKAHTEATRALRLRKVEDTVSRAHEIAPPDKPYNEPKLLDPSQPNAAEINELTKQAVQNGVLSSLSLFQQRHPEYVRSESSAAALCRFVHNAGMSPANPESWEKAWAALRDVLQPEQPVAVAADEPAPVAVLPRVRASGTPTPIASGLSSVDSWSEYQEPMVITPKVAPMGQRLYTERELSLMPADNMKRLLANKAQAALINQSWDAIEQAKAQARTAARR